MEDLYVLYDPIDKTFLRAYYVLGERNPWWTSSFHGAAQLTEEGARKKRDPLVSRIIPVPLHLAKNRATLEVFAAAHKAFA